METFGCPRCGAGMEEIDPGYAVVRRCPDGHGVFLESAELGALIEAENDWHRHAGQHTSPMPRITPDMEAPPAGRRSSRAWVETLFR